MKKVLIISTSLRKDSNSEILSHEFMKGAKEAGHEVELISLKGKKIEFCKGCLACQRLGECIIDDDVNAITKKIRESNVIVWATPVYYYEMSGQMKTLIDRANSLFFTDNNFNEVYLIATSADSSKGVVKTVLNGINGWISCLDGVKLSGFLEAGGLDTPNEVNESKDLLEKAYIMGRNV
ncbi:flavodoxin family protein [bacterium]|nr:flavodoxin family protein [bacterium]